MDEGGRRAEKSSRKGLGESGAFDVRSVGGVVSGTEQGLDKMVAM